MRKSLLSYLPAVLATLLLVNSGCKRTTAIDNNNVIMTPYSLFIGDTAGALFNTNDGRNIKSVLFRADGKPSRAITTAGPNIIWAKDNLYYSSNNGVNFNLTLDTLTRIPRTNCYGQQIDLNQSMLYTVSSWGDRVYAMCSSPAGNNWLGLAFSDGMGTPSSWSYEGSYDTVKVGILPVRMKSLTMLANGVLCGLAYSIPYTTDTIHHRNFVKCGKDESLTVANRWSELTANPTALPYIYLGNTGGTPLPPYGTFTATGNFSLGHINNRLIAIDASCNYGAWYSDDSGSNWRQFSSMPTGVPLLCINTPFEEVCLIGTAGNGVYMYDVSTASWRLSNTGLASNVTVRSIVGKRNVYKNGTERRYIYLATDKGIYESSNGGFNWVLTVPGNFVSVY